MLTTLDWNSSRPGHSGGMPDLALWTFDDHDRITRAERLVARVAADHDLVVDDALVLAWPDDTAGPSHRRVYSVALSSPRSDAEWIRLLDFVGRSAGRLDPDRLFDCLLIGLRSVGPELGPARDVFPPDGKALLVLGTDPALGMLVTALDGDAEASRRGPVVIDGLVDVET
jgi:hypothetical protein